MRKICPFGSMIEPVRCCSKESKKSKKRKKGAKMADPLLDAALREDSAWIAGWLTARQMINVTPEMVERWMPRLRVYLKGVKDAVEERNKELQEALQIPEKARLFEKLHGPQKKIYFSDLISGGTIDLWLRKRMDEDDLFSAECKGVQPVHLHVPLHIGFIYIEETPLMLWLLGCRDDERIGKALGVATPKIERTQVKIQPIDRVAARVAPVEKPED